MAPFSRLLLVALLLVAVTGGSGTNYGEAHYDRVFSFGDSLIDTGNSAILPATAGGPFTNPPYGETYFKRPSGRASDGRLVIDFIGINHSTSNHQLWYRFICVDLHSSSFSSLWIQWSRWGCRSQRRTSPAGPRTTFGTA
jgi:hypothetical protein